jgi:hypothetical protein
MNDIFLAVISWGTFVFAITYLGVAYYISPKRSCLIFAFYFVLAYILEVIFISLMLFVVNKMIGRTIELSIWKLVFQDVIYILVFSFVITALGRYLLYDRKHLKKT